VTPPTTEATLARLYDTESLKLAMVHGPHDGETVEWSPDREVPTGYMFAVQPEMPPFCFWIDVDSPPSIPRTLTDLYCFTGHIRDDGARLYEYGGRS
jgi:hypothetical protein